MALKTRTLTAGSDAQRLEDLMVLSCRDDLAAIMAIRGGYGSIRLLNLLGEKFYSSLRPLIGFSDITALHLARLAKSGQGGWHAPNLTTLGKYTDQELGVFFDLISGEKRQRSWSFKPGWCLRDGRGSGPIIGGNLSLICSLLETGWLPSFDGAILMLEEVSEFNYRFDRMLTTLRLSGRLNGLAGLVFGHLHKCGHILTLNPILKDFVSYLPEGVPAVRAAPFGHWHPNDPWWQGENAELIVKDRNASLTFLDR
jgi:muramoyltetrapeptide carboxypeptidase